MTIQFEIRIVLLNRYYGIFVITRVYTSRIDLMNITQILNSNIIFTIDALFFAQKHISREHPTRQNVLILIR